MKSQTYTFTVNHDESPLRLDQAIAAHIEPLSREKAKRIIEIGGVWVNKKRLHTVSRKVVNGDGIEVHIGRNGWSKYYEINKSNILYEDEWLLFYRKEPGIPTQGIFCDDYNNLYAGLLRYRKNSTKAPYLGLHHRLDIDTSGVIVFTCSAKINRSIHYQFKDRRVKKFYLALVSGVPDFTENTVTTYINRQNGRYTCSTQGPGKLAMTRFTTISNHGTHSLLRAEPETGRTHQIRLQLAFSGLPILGDPRYGSGPRKTCKRTMLHAESLSLIHPFTKETLTISAAPYDDMQQLMSHNL
ncbi:MAG: RluA family pseudouridine synthase [bacterium]|nr:RluA family pseudouridine synthase [bacterium]